MENNSKGIFMKAKSSLKIAIVFYIFVFIGGNKCFASSEYFVSSISELINVLESAENSSVITLRDGSYTLSNQIRISNLTGTEEKSFVIKAENTYNVKFDGPGSFLFEDCNYVIFKGFEFNSAQAVTVRDCQHFRISECKFNLSQQSIKKHWVRFSDTYYARVDNCEFGPRTEPGSFLHFDIGNRYMRVDHNYFHDYKYLGINGGETIYLHGSGVWALWAVVEDNLFERCNGETELIGIKSHRNIIRRNTFLNCQGAVSIRDGNYNQVYSNKFICTDDNPERTRAVRIFGKHNTFVNNYMYRIEDPVGLIWGEVDSPHKEEYPNFAKVSFAYRAAYDNLIAFNTFYQTGNVFDIGKKGVKISDETFNESAYGPFRKELWEAEVKNYLIGNYVQPVYAPKNFYWLNNIFFSPETWVYEYFSRESSPPATEVDFVWKENYLASEDEPDFQERKYSESEIQQLDIPILRQADYYFEPDYQTTGFSSINLDETKLAEYTSNEEVTNLLKELQHPGANLDCCDFQYLLTSTKTPMKQTTDAMVKIYPSPFTDFLKLEIKQGVAEFELQLIDQSGRTVLNKHFYSATSVRLCTSDFNAGFYLLRLISDKEIRIYKLIKK
jgi:hypothetical protein